MNIRNIARAIVTILAMSFMFIQIVDATPPPHLNWGAKITDAQCEPSNAGPPVINIKRRVLNSLDSGFSSDIWWAQDDYNQGITVYQSNENTFCVVSRFQGKFYGLPGHATPNDNGMLDGDEQGTFQGGYHAIIEGDLKPRGQFGWSAFGNVGTFDYNCDPTASRGSWPPNCPGSVDVFGQYFDTIDSFSYQWWGWIYRGGRYGTFVNSSEFNEGDIQ